MSEQPKVLRLERPGRIPDPPPDLGRLMTAEEIAHELFNDAVKSQWVKRNVVAGRVKLGHCTVRWSERLVRAWLAEQVESEVHT